MLRLGATRQVQPDRREAPRDEVYHRTRITLADGRSASVQLVNVSATGFMIRSEEELGPDTPFKIKLPRLGDRPAESRWSLAGRVGCQFGQPIGLADYLELLGTLVREG